jgi:hypothetical protein
MLHALKNLDPRDAETVRPEAEMPLSLTFRRGNLRAVLIAQSWFPESQLLSVVSKPGKLTESGYVAENNALRALKRKGFINYNRERVWLI